MNKRIVGAFLLLLVGAAAIAGVWYLLPYYQDMKQKQTSDALHTKGKITVALDNWIGYFILRSPELRNQMRAAGWLLVCEDDNADYAARMERLRDKKIDFAVATVDSYIVNAQRLGFPGTIIMVVDESKGGDAIVSRSDKIPNLDAVRGRDNITVAFTPASPSHHLLKAASYHFSVPELLPPRGPRRVETNGSAEALTRLLAGKADLAVMWEPDVSRALSNPGTKKLLGTEDTEKLIVDILVVNRDFAKSNPDAVKQLLSAYFRVLKKYSDTPALLRQHIVAETGLGEAVVDTMLKGIRWVNLTENCEKWFGIAPPGGTADHGLVGTIQSTVNILMNAGDFTADPLPSGDPYRLIYSAYLEDVFVKGISGFTTPKPGGLTAGSKGPLEAKTQPLDDAGWNKLREVGSLRIEPVVFQRGATELDLFAKEVIDQAVDLLRHYPRFRVLIRGHTGTAGDPEENRRLSEDRANSVARYLEVTHNIDPNRLRAIGRGSTQPLPRKPDESERSWEYRLPRVELVLVRDEE